VIRLSLPNDFAQGVVDSVRRRAGRSVTPVAQAGEHVEPERLAS
jgi:hypothetical protein